MIEILPTVIFKNCIPMLIKFSYAQQELMNYKLSQSI